MESLAKSVGVAPSAQRALDDDLRLEFQVDAGEAGSPVAFGEVKVSGDGPGPNVRTRRTRATGPETLVHVVYIIENQESRLYDAKLHAVGNE